jgi:hypothetical protein
MTGAEFLAADLATSPLARTIARDHVLWARQAGLSPLGIGRALGSITRTWEEAAARLATAWEDYCGRGVKLEFSAA